MTKEVKYHYHNEITVITQLFPSMPKVHEKMFKKEVERLVLLGVLEVENDSE